MKVDIKVPAVGESITEATIAEWLKKDGDAVKKNDVLLSLETDKATVEVVAENDGKLSILTKAGTTIQIGSVVGSIDTEAKGNVAAPTAAVASPSVATPAPAANSSAAASLSPAVRRVVAENNLDPTSIQGTGKDGRITKFDAESATAKAPTTPAPAIAPPKPTAAVASSGGVRRVPMTTIRKRIAQRLLESQHNAATLTTFNEIDMTAVMSLREKYKDKFKEKHGVGLGFNGFFVKAAIEALKAIPEVNAFIEGDEIVYHDYYNIGIAVGTEKGLVVPSIKNAENLSLSGVELAIRNFATKARDGKISPTDLGGGTFTITNGGVYGSLMSTPILNPPQSAILGLHKIEDRAVVIDKKIEIRPMMYVALSYDHRIVDGKEAVTFLVKVKEAIEDPQRILLEV